MQNIKPLVLSGPSGSGKTYLMNFLTENYGFKNVLSTMTRQPRVGEIHMVDNEYLSHEEFDEVEKSGDFILVINIFGEKYGYRKSFIEDIKKQGLIPVAIMFTPHIELFTRNYPESLTVYLYPKSLSLLEKRMRMRGDSEEIIKKRLASAEEEMRSYREDVKEFYQMCFQIYRDEDVEIVVEKIIDYYSLKN